MAKSVRRMTDDLEKQIKKEVPRKWRFRHSISGRNYIDEEHMIYYNGIMPYGKD